MGYRTIVMLSNDLASTWQNDPELGKKIARAMNYAMGQSDHFEARLGNYGQVVQCTHADHQSLVILDSYTSFQELATKSWARGESEQDKALKLLKDAANKMGYRLVKNSVA